MTLKQLKNWNKCNKNLKHGDIPCFFCEKIIKWYTLIREEKLWLNLKYCQKIEKQKDTIDQTIEYFKKNKLKHLYLGHCVTDEVIEYIESKLPNVQIHRLQTGKEFEIDENSKVKS